MGKINLSGTKIVSETGTVPFQATTRSTNSKEIKTVPDSKVTEMVHFANIQCTDHIW